MLEIDGFVLSRVGKKLLQDCSCRSFFAFEIIAHAGMIRHGQLRGSATEFR